MTTFRLEPQWPVAKLREQGLYFNFHDIQAYLEHGRVEVAGFGEMILLGHAGVHGHVRGRPLLVHAVVGMRDERAPLRVRDGARLVRVGLSTNHRLQRAVPGRAVHARPRRGPPPLCLPLTHGRARPYSSNQPITSMRST